MKKFLFSVVALLCLTAFSANAQIISYSQTKITKAKSEIPPVKIGFQQAVEFQGGLGIVNSSPCAIINYIAGYRINNTVFVGGGIGGGAIQAQIFANAKFYMTNTRVQPFGEISLGGALADDFGIHSDSYYDGSSYSLFGLLITPQIGVNIRTTNRLNYFFALGIQILPMHPEFYPLLKAGISF